MLGHSTNLRMKVGSGERTIVTPPPPPTLGAKSGGVVCDCTITWCHRIQGVQDFCQRHPTNPEDMAPEVTPPPSAPKVEVRYVTAQLHDATGSQALQFLRRGGVQGVQDFCHMHLTNPADMAPEVTADSWICFGLASNVNHGVMGGDSMDS